MVVGSLKDPQKHLADFAADGTVLLAMMEAPSGERATEIHRSVRPDLVQPSAVTADRITKWSALSENGWVPTRLGRPEPDMLREYASAVHTMKIHDDFRFYNLRYRFKHIGYTPDWEHPGTNAESLFSFNHADRGVIIEQAQAPAFVMSIKDAKCPEDACIPVDLYRMSDLMYVGWSHTANNNTVGVRYDLGDLEWILIDSVQEPYTQYILNSIFMELRLEPAIARKFDFMTKHYLLSAEERPGQLILGSPLGRIVSWFLIQHKETLGLKKVTDIVVFSDDDLDLPNARMRTMRTPVGDTYRTPINPMHMMFLIEDIVEEQEGEREVQQQQAAVIEAMRAMTM